MGSVQVLRVIFLSVSRDRDAAVKHKHIVSFTISCLFARHKAISSHAVYQHALVFFSGVAPITLGIKNSALLNCARNISSRLFMTLQMEL